MVEKNSAEVVIDGKVLRIAGNESSDYLHQVAAYINEKLAEFERIETFRRQKPDKKQVLMYMNLADDFFKARELTEKQKEELDKTEKEMYSVKHDLIDAQMALDALEKSTKEDLVQLKKSFKEDLEQQKSEDDALLQEKEEELTAVKKELEAKSIELEKVEKELLEVREAADEEIAQLQEQLQNLRKAAKSSYENRNNSYGYRNRRPSGPQVPMSSEDYNNLG